MLLVTICLAEVSFIKLKSIIITVVLLSFVTNYAFKMSIVFALYIMLNLSDFQQFITTAIIIKFIAITFYHQKRLNFRYFVEFFFCDLAF